MKKRSYSIFFCLFLVFIRFWDVTAQEWEAALIFPISDMANQQVLELFPDTIQDCLYVGGVFRTIGSDTFRNIVAYDGVYPHKVLNGDNLCVNGGCSGVATITRYQNGIVASLVNIGVDTDSPIIGIGSWDGEQWSHLDGGIALEYLDGTNQYFPTTAYDFCVWDDTLYVAGYLPIIDSMPAEGVGAWDGNQWHTFNLFEGIPTDAILATSVAKYQGNLYLGGNIILTINGETLNDLIMYDGTTWQKVGDGLVDGLTNLHDMEVFQNKLYVAGYFTQADGNPGNSIMSWDGEQWNDLSGGVCSDGIIDDLFVYEDKLYVAGLFNCIGDIEAHNVAVWDGTKWCSIGHSVFNGPVNTIAVWRDTVYAGGSFYQIDGQPVRFLARFVGDLSGSICSEPVSDVESLSTPTSFISLFPNPAGSVLTINRSGRSRLLRYEIVDLLGRTWWSGADCADKGIILVSGWPSGSYVVRVVGEDETGAQIFVKR